MTIEAQLTQFIQPKQRIPMKETELAKTVIDWLQAEHWDVYQEVQFDQGHAVADIVAVRNNIVWIIECKTAYTFEVLEQASRWPVHYRSVAVPWTRSQRNYHVAKHYYRVGVLLVHGNEVKEHEPAPLYVRGRKENYVVKLYRKSLLELHKTFAEAGSRAGSHLTPYKLTMMAVRKVIEDNPGCNIGFLYDTLGRMHYSSKDSFKGNLLTALDSFEPWCRIDKSKVPYRLYVREGASK